MKILSLICLLIIIISTNIKAQTEPKESYCINKEEKQLLKLINDYRKTKKLPPIPLSASLTKVAKIHAYDLETNQPVKGKCNMHSWSDKGKWKACCYTDDHKNAALMWSKPAELTNYKAEGYEIAFESSATVTPEAALAGWKKSPGHNSVITEKGVFLNMKWKAIGISVRGNYALVWFGAEKDPEPALQDCK
jgi:uncharacterized protein YkwD